MVNFERLDAVMTFISDHPERHEQSTFLSERACGTVGCVAGWAVSMFAPECLSKDTRPVTGDTWVDLGQDVLGLSHDQADAMFMSDNTRDRLEEMVKALHNDPDADLWVIYHRGWLSEVLPRPGVR